MDQDGRLHHRWLALIPLLLFTACSDAAAPAASSAAAPDEATCQRMAEAAVAPAQAFLDDLAGMSDEGLATLDVPPDLPALQQDVATRVRFAVGQGCGSAAVERIVDERVAALRGEGEVAEALAAALRGEVDGGSGPRPPRRATASQVSVQPGDDVADVLARVGPGSTVSFAAGTYAVADTLLLDTDLRLLGAGRDETVIETSAAGLGIAFVGPGALEMSGLTVRHTGDEVATVFVAIEGPLSVSDARFAGGVSGDQTTGGGHGFVLAFENSEGLPERTDFERAGNLVIADSLFEGNGGAGLLAAGVAAPAVTSSTFIDNGTCGFCAAGTAGGRVSGSTFERNQVGVQLSDASTTEIAGNTLTANAGVGVSVDGPATSAITDNTIADTGGTGVQLTGSGHAVVSTNTLRGNPVGLLLTDTVAADVVDNTFDAHDVGVQAGGEAALTMTGNTITNVAVAGVSVGATASAALSSTTISGAAGVGIEVTGSATATVSDNSVSGDGDAGLSVTEAATASGSANTIDGRRVGVQVGGTASLSLDGDQIAGSAVAGVLFTDDSRGELTGLDITASPAAGIIVGGRARPTITGTTIRDSGSAVVVREDGAPTLSGNTLRANQVGLQVEERGAPEVTGNTIADSVNAAVVIAGESRGSYTTNTLANNGPIGLQVGGTASPTVTGNTVTGPGDYALLYVEAGAGTAEANRVNGYQIGIHLSGYTSPSLTGNILEAPGAAAIAYTEASAGSASGNQCPAADIPGIVKVPTATPALGDNDCPVLEATP